MSIYASISARGVLRLSLIAVVAAGCGRSPGLQEFEGRPGMQRFLMQFPCDAEPGDDADRQTLAALLKGASTFENEVHDCQRLVESGQFGPLIGIFPHPGELSTIDETSTGPLSVATIFSWGDASGDPTYAPLGIQGDWNCLWVRRDGPDSDWEAAIIENTSDTTCVGSPPPANLWPLEVRASRPANPQDSIPKTARWRWDSEDHYIGIYGGKEWWSVGPDGFQPTEPDVFTGPPHEVIPGYFDEQHLALPSGGDLVPGPWGKISPSPALLANGKNSGWWTTPRGVARLEVADPPGPYEDKFNLQLQGTIWRSQIRLHLTDPTPPDPAWSGWYRRPDGSEETDERPFHS